MEPHGGRTTEEGSPAADPAPEASGSSGATGLQESVEQSRLGGEREGEGESEPYPERPGEADCLHYLRTGYCRYGSRCRFNHPRDGGRVLITIASARPSGGEFPERVGQPVCQYYIRTGTCKYGASCKYHHPKQGGPSATPVALNYYGYPLRPGEKQCSYYVKTGQCKFGPTCKFHHPEPFDIQVSAAQALPQVSQIPAARNPTSLYPPVQPPTGPSSQEYGVVVRPTFIPGPYVGPYGPVLYPPGIVPFTGVWGPYPAPITPVAAPAVQPGVGPSSVSGVMQLPSSGIGYAGPYQPVQSSLGPSSSSQREHSFPQRPGQPECQYYMKTGVCKFGSSCRYHHPLELSAERSDAVVLNSDGLPLRPGAQPCVHYAQHGVCRFGPTCKFDHSMGSLSFDHSVGSLSCSPSTSSLSDMPVAPYPVGSVGGTLAPSSSSSDLRPELVSGSSQEPISTNLTSTMSTFSESVGSLYSSSGSSPSVQQSGPGASPSTTSCNSTSSTEAHASS